MTAEYERCGRCSGEGSLAIRLGKPDPDRDRYALYAGPWCLYPTVDCSACLGTGWRKIKTKQPNVYL